MSTTLTAHGVLRPDGWIELLDATDLPAEPCEVEVTLSLSKPTATDSVPPAKPWTREPGGFWPDESISAPFDLPYYGPSRPVKVRKATGPYLPPNPIFPLVPDGIAMDAGERQ